METWCLLKNVTKWFNLLHIFNQIDLSLNNHICVLDSLKVRRLIHKYGWLLGGNVVLCCIGCIIFLRPESNYSPIPYRLQACSETKPREIVALEKHCCIHCPLDFSRALHVILVRKPYNRCMPCLFHRFDLHIVH